MQSISWAALLRHFPVTFQEGLVVKTLNGTEIAVQSILRIDQEFFAVKGRLAGTQDVGRIFFVPYSQVDHLGYQKELPDSEFKSIFDKLVMPSPEAAWVTTSHDAVEEPPSDAITPPIEPAEAGSVASADPVNPVPLKSAVLERFRARSGSPSPIDSRPSQA